MSVYTIHTTCIKVEARQKLVLEAEEAKEKNGKTVVPDDVGKLP